MVLMASCSIEHAERSTFATPFFFLLYFLPSAREEVHGHDNENDALAGRLSRTLAATPATLASGRMAILRRPSNYGKASTPGNRFTVPSTAWFYMRYSCMRWYMHWMRYCYSQVDRPDGLSIYELSIYESGYAQLAVELALDRRTWLEGPNVQSWRECGWPSRWGFVVGMMNARPWRTRPVAQCAVADEGIATSGSADSSLDWKRWQPAGFRGRSEPRMDPDKHG